MNTSDAMTANPRESHAYSDAKMPASRVIYWAVVRELWESPSIYVAPAAVATVFLIGVAIASGFVPHHMAPPPGSHGGHALMQAYDFAAAVVMLTVVLLQLLYCLDALYGERRDRSILFWKSLPVSDGVTVMAKAFVPMIILPVFGMAVTLLAQWGVLLIATVFTALKGDSVTALWGSSSIIKPAALLFYHLITVHTFWYAPLYCWILLISAWAKRTPIVWVVFPPVAIYGFEKLVFGTSHFTEFLGARLLGGSESMTGPGQTTMGIGTHPTPISFLINPGLWIGLAIAAAFLYGAARLRRYHEPI